MEDDFQGAERRDSGDSTALYGSWYGTLRVVARHTTDGIALSYYFFRTQKHGDTEESILSVLIRAIRALRMGGNRRTQYVAFLQPCGMQAEAVFQEVTLKILRF
jgi:hypothetical protein